MPNQFRLLTFVFAYILLLEIREALPRSERNISVQTLLMRFIKVGALVQITTHAVKFRLSISHPWQSAFISCAHRLQVAA
ncbi:MAG: transposase [Candidatus Obscuribacterales bacterium]|nr:transposase [Candidatus Obscuribacterales bacterium]